MNYYKLKYSDGNIKIVPAKSILEVITKYDLASRGNAHTHITQLSGEQLVIAISNTEGGK